MTSNKLFGALFLVVGIISAVMLGGLYLNGGSIKLRPVCSFSLLFLALITPRICIHAKG